jgi:hypothetical protein
MGAKALAETDFKAKLDGKPEFKPVFPDALAAYDKISDATKTLAAQATRQAALEDAHGFNCESFSIARTLLRAGDERPKPNGERLREFSDSRRASLELGLFSEKPIYTDLEILTLADSLTFLVGQLGVSDPLVQRVLDGKPPRERAVNLINSTKVRDVAFRKRLYEGGTNAVSEVNDPMIELARFVDTEARALRKVSDEQDEAKQQAHAAISRARNALFGNAGYPDATSTLRLSFGTIKGYEEDGKLVTAFTTFAGLYERAREMKNRPPFDLPALWEKSQSRLDLTTPLNFVNTCDAAGGNSGSPVVNRAGEFVGILFDGNLQGIPWDYAFTDKQGRSISVDSAAILEALKEVYGTKELARELENGRQSP